LHRSPGLFLGTQYLRPPNPRPEDWDRDLGRIRETGLEMIRVWLFWASVNPRPGVWRWEEYDRLFDLAEKHSLTVLLQIVPESAPYWYEDHNPDTRYIDKDGRPIEFNREAVQFSGGPCLHNAAARSATEEYMRLVAERYRGRAGLYGYDAWNEVGLPECYCRATQSRYRHWLQQRYGTIEALNRKYRGDYESFSELRVPKGGAYSYALDHLEFRHAVVEEQLEWRAKTLRNADPDHPVVSHWHGDHPLVSYPDAWALSDPVDVWGTSSYIGYDGLTPAAVHALAMQFNSIRDSAQGKPWWLAEHPGGSVWGGYGEQLRTEMDSRLKTLLAFSFGARASLYWQWRPEIYGSESPHFGLTGFDGELTARTETLRLISQALLKHKDLLDRLHWPAPQIGMLWDTRSPLFEERSAVSDRERKQIGTRNFQGYYNALIDQGYSVRILNARLVARDGVPEDIRIVFAPFQIFDREGLSQKLNTWVRAGGTLFAGPLYGLFDSATYLNAVVPPQDLTGVFGVRHDQLYYPANPVIRTGEDGPLKLPPMTIEGKLLVETFHLAGAGVSGTWADKPVLTVNRYGRGHGVMCGLLAGAAYSSGQPAALRTLITAACRLAGAEPQAGITDGALVRVANSGKNPIVFLFNPFDQPRLPKLTLNGGSGVVFDLFAGRQTGRVASGQPIAIPLQPKESKVLQVKSGQYNKAE